MNIHHTRRCRSAILTAAALSLLAASLSAPQAQAATIRVDSLRCTLQDAVVAANEDRPQGGCPAGSGDDIIRIAPGSDIVIDASRVPLDEGGTGRSALRVTHGRLTVIGNSSSIRRLPDDPAFRAFALSGSAVVTLDGITLSGFLTLDGGAAIRVDDDASLTLRRSNLRNNLSFPFGSGGGLLLSSRGAQRIDASSISENVGNDSGGGIALLGLGKARLGDVTIVNSTLSGNQANVYGGAAISADAPVRLTVVSSTITGNLGFGGTSAGAIAMGVGELRLQQSIVAGNDNPRRIEVFLADTRTLSNDNVLGSADPERTCVNSFIGLAFGANDRLTDCTGSSPLPLRAIIDSVLRDNPGAAPTHRLVPGSPAIDRIAQGSCLRLLDARGVTRPVDGDNDGVAACDAGAHEFNEPFARFNPSRVDFGTVAPDVFSTRPVELSNIGASPLTIRGLGIRPQCCTETFTVEDNSCPTVLAAGARCTLLLRFEPLNAGTFTGRLVLNSNDPRGLRGVALSGSQAPVSAARATAH